MSYGIIGYSAPSFLSQPSGSIWGDSFNQELIDQGQGSFVNKDFKETLPILDSTGTGPLQTVAWEAASTGGLTWSSVYDSVASLTSGHGTASDDAGIATRPLGPVVSGGGGKLWFETCIALAQIAAAQAVFVGVANLASLGTKKLISAASATKNSNTIGTSAGGQSFYGFWLHGDTPTNFDAVWANNISTALTPTTIASPGTSATGAGVVLASVLTASSSYNPNIANAQNPPFTSVPSAPGALPVVNTAAGAQTLLNSPSAATNAVGSQVATGFVKLGIYYDGQQYLYWFVNGYQVAKLLITTAQDQASDFAGVAQVAAGQNATSPVLDILFLRAASLLVP